MGKETIDVKVQDGLTGFVFAVSQASVTYVDRRNHAETVPAEIGTCERDCPHKLSQADRTLVEFAYRSTGNPARICYGAGSAYLGNGKPGCRALTYVNGQ